MPALPYVANAVISGTLTGIVYGLMALGLSTIFGVVRLVNFAHGELMTLAMYGAVGAFQGLALDPFLTMIAAAVVFGGFGYLLQRGFINRFIHRPEHLQMLLMIALALIIGNGLLLAFGPDARSVQTSYQLDSFELGPLLVDKVRVYAAVAAVVATAPARRSAPAPTIRSAPASPACRSPTSTPSPSGWARPRSRWPAAPWSSSSTSHRGWALRTPCWRSSS
jgi:branched-chain amino acid transport system permease protein